MRGHGHIYVQTCSRIKPASEYVVNVRIPVQRYATAGAVKVASSLTRVGASAKYRTHAPPVHQAITSQVACLAIFLAAIDSVSFRAESRIRSRLSPSKKRSTA